MQFCAFAGIPTGAQNSGSPHLLSAPDYRLGTHARKRQASGMRSRFHQAPPPALANLAVADDYGDWLISQRSAVSPELDPDF